ncbi:MAG TPA: DNA adenine methylase [Bacteroidia bacterium]|nr:DNA adenine methylase [Bacteroidia bacterium]
MINFYKVIKTNFLKLARAIRSTLHSRECHHTAKVMMENPKIFNEIQRAWAVWVLCNQSFGSILGSTWRCDFKDKTSAKRISRKRNDFTKVYAERMEEVQIECRDALKVIESTDSTTTFFYCDPPYFNAHQGHYKGYTEEDFDKLLRLLSTIKGKFLLSSYPSPLLEKYAKKYKWFTKKVEMPVSISLNSEGKQKIKTEVLTGNYEI